MYLASAKYALLDEEFCALINYENASENRHQFINYKIKDGSLTIFVLLTVQPFYDWQRYTVPTELIFRNVLRVLFFAKIVKQPQK